MTHDYHDYIDFYNEFENLCLEAKRCLLITKIFRQLLMNYKVLIIRLKLYM